MSAVAASRRSACAALSLETIRAIHRFIAAGLEWNARFAVAAGARGHEQLAAWRGAVATRGIRGWTKRIGSLGFARRTARRTTTRWIVKPATRVKLLLTTRKDERRIAIAACERFVCVLHADSRKKEVVEVIANRTGYVGAPWGR